MFSMMSSLNSFLNIFLREKKKNEKNWKERVKYKIARDPKQLTSSNKTSQPRFKI